jgi:hypothetical protein
LSYAPGHPELVRQLLAFEVGVLLVLEATHGDHHVDDRIAEYAP